MRQIYLFLITGTTISLNFWILVCFISVTACEDKHTNNLTDDDSLSVSDSVFPGFDKSIGGPYNQFGYAVERTHDGGFIIIGSTDTPSGGGNSYLYFVKTNSNGDTVWTRTYAHEQVDEESFKMIRQTQDNGFVVAFTNYTIVGKILKLDSDGQIVWTKSYARWYKSVYPTPDGGYIAIGENLTRLNSDGDSIWTRPIPGNDVKPTYDGYIICGDTYPDKFLLTKTDQNGNMVFSRNYGPISPTLTFDGNALIVTSDLGFLVTGSRYGRLFVVKTNSNGDSLWTRLFEPPGTYNEVNAVVEVSDGYVITGIQGNGSAVLKLDFNGVTKWFFYKTSMHAYGITNESKNFIISGHTYTANWDITLFSLTEN